MTVYLGVDPGVTTGLALIRVYKVTEPKLLDFSLVRGGYQGLIESTELAHLLNLCDEVVIESFVLRRGGPMTADQIAPTYGIGVVSSQAHPKPVHLRTPAENKSAVDNKALKNLDLWGEGNNDFRHARDAARVVAGHLKAIKHLPTLRKGWPPSG